MFDRQTAAHHPSYPLLKLARQEIAFAVVPSAWHEEVAAVLGLPIATLDGGIKTACRVHGVQLFEPPA